MKAAANFAFVNRQVLTFHIRNSFEQVLAGKVSIHHVFQIYDIAHNMAKVESHRIDGKQLRSVFTVKERHGLSGPAHRNFRLFTVISDNRCWFPVQWDGILGFGRNRKIDVANLWIDLSWCRADHEPQKSQKNHPWGDIA